MTPERQTVLLERALWLIMGEWGYSRERALAWLEDESADHAMPIRPPATQIGRYVGVGQMGGCFDVNGSVSLTPKINP